MDITLGINDYNTIQEDHLDIDETNVQADFLVEEVDCGIKIRNTIENQYINELVNLSGCTSTILTKSEIYKKKGPIVLLFYLSQKGLLIDIC